MTTRMTINGVSTCAEAGTEKYERFQLGIGKPTLDECRAARDKWLNAKKGKEDRL